MITIIQERCLEIVLIFISIVLDPLGWLLRFLFYLKCFFWLFSSHLSLLLSISLLQVGPTHPLIIAIARRSLAFSGILICLLGGFGGLPL